MKSIDFILFNWTKLYFISNSYDTVGKIFANNGKQNPRQAGGKNFFHRRSI